MSRVEALEGLILRRGRFGFEEVEIRYGEQCNEGLALGNRDWNAQRR